MSLINVWKNVRKWGGRILLGSGAITLLVTVFAAAETTLVAWIIFLAISAGIGWFIDYITCPKEWNVDKDVVG